ncbi:hypothetical protein [Trebonia sp.]|uniref:hypothetical protein n=1 Tax=Trebonia sp. TaxID=2767075 RepID=UPI00261EF9A8|nr:hypothetical protein [Trebonia sp.]
MPRLLVVHHTASPALQAMLAAVIAGARDPELENIDLAVTPALAATVPVAVTGPAGKDVERQCYELGATVAANLG